MFRYSKRDFAGGSTAPGDEPGPREDGGQTVLIDAIPGGQVERRQHREGASLSQTIALRRQDGSVWTAYARQHPLPSDPGAANRATREASSILMLMAQAVAAADTARQARSVMLDWDGPMPAWQVHYD